MSQFIEKYYLLWILSFHKNIHLAKNLFTILSIPTYGIVDLFAVRFPVTNSRKFRTVLNY